VHVIGRNDVYPVKTSKVGCLLHYVIADNYTLHVLDAFCAHHQEY